MPFASINSTHPRTNPRNFHEKILRIGEALKMTNDGLRITKKFFFSLSQGKIYLQEKKTIPRWILKKTNLFRISEQIFIHLFLKKVYYDKIIRFSGQGSLELNFLNTL